MMLGLSLAAFTGLHVVISLIAIGAGLFVLAGMAANSRIGGWTALFLATTIATSITGFMFPPKPIGPPHVFGAVSLVLLAGALFALYGARLAGAWRGAYVVAATVSLYLNVVVLVVQSFQKIPALIVLAPKGSEPPFLAAQGLALVIVGGLGWLAFRNYRPSLAGARPAAA